MTDTTDHAGPAAEHSTDDDDAIVEPAAERSTDDDDAIVEPVGERSTDDDDAIVEPVGGRRSGALLDELAELEEERRFLLKSLRDLEREHEAGDVDADDYATLKDGYTVRTAAVLRQIEAGRRRLAPKEPTPWLRRIVTWVAVLLVAGGIGVMLAQAWGERGAGDEITGQRVGDDVRALLANARSVQFSDPARANELFFRAVELENERGVDNPEPLTYYAWTLALLSAGNPDAAEVEQQLELALLSLDRAIKMDPEYPDPHCFVGIIQYRFRDEPAAALPFIETCRAGNPPADIDDLVAPLETQLRAELADRDDRQDDQDDSRATGESGAGDG